MSVADYLSMQKRAYSQLATTREAAEQAVHPRYAQAARQAYPTLAYILNDYAERTASFALETDVEAIRAQLLQVSKEIKILDFGCGVGRLMEALASSGFSPDGVDISTEMLGFAQASESLRSAGSKFYLSAGSDCGAAPAGHYDLAYSVLCFQHICVRTVRQGILKSLRDCLQPEGVICIQFQFFPGIAVSDIPDGHAAWTQDQTNVSGTNSRHDVWVTADMLPQLLADFSSLFSDVRLQFIDLPTAEFRAADGRKGAYQHLFVSGSKSPGLHERFYSRPGSN